MAKDDKGGKDNKHGTFEGDYSKGKGGSGVFKDPGKDQGKHGDGKKKL